MIVNTQYFREPANHFEKHGCYTFAPPGSEEWILYWDEQEKLCKEGLKVGDMWITGKHYFALNFCPMERIKTKEEYAKDPLSESIYTLPRFWRLDYEFWIIKHIMQYGATPEEIKKWNFPFLKSEGYSPGKNLVILKTRRGGYSYKEAAEAVWNYTFIRKSKSFFYFF